LASSDFWYSISKLLGASWCKSRPRLGSSGRIFRPTKFPKQLCFRGSGGFRGDEEYDVVVGLEFHQQKLMFSNVFWVGEAYFSRNSLVPLAGARISQEISWSGWPGGVFLKKKAGLDGLGAYFSRKTNEKYVQISFFHKTLKIHQFLIDFFWRNFGISHLCATLDLRLYSGYLAGYPARYPAGYQAGCPARYPWILYMDIIHG